MTIMATPTIEPASSVTLAAGALRRIPDMRLGPLSTYHGGSVQRSNSTRGFVSILHGQLLVRVVAPTGS